MPALPAFLKRACWARVGRHSSIGHKPAQRGNLR